MNPDFGVDSVTFVASKFSPPSLVELENSLLVESIEPPKIDCSFDLVVPRYEQFRMLKSAISKPACKRPAVSCIDDVSWKEDVAHER